MAFAGYLKQSTSVTVMLGPFVDEDDGKTAEDGLTITQADVRLSKNGGNMAQKNDANAATHDEIGIYSCQLDATDTGTLGILDVMVHESGALPIHQSYQVVTANWWDTMCAADQLDVNVTNIEGGDATDAINAACDTALSDYDGPTNAEMEARTLVAADYFDPDNDTVANVTTVATLTGHTAQTGDNYARLGAPAGVSVSADIADIPTVAEFEARTIVAADYFDPDNDAVANVTLVATTTTNTDMVSEPPTAAAIADAVWDELSAGHTDAGKAGEQIWTDLDAVLADTGELQGDDVPGLIGALNDLSAADVNAEVDTALADYDPPTKAELDSGLAGLNDPTAGDVADAVWDEAIADHQGVGSTGEMLQDIDDEVDVIHDAILAMGLSGSAVGVLAESATVTTGSQTNTYTSTHAADETYHQVAEDGNEVDFYYQFDIGTDGIPVAVTAKGRVDEGAVPSGGDRVYIAAYYWDGASWDTMGYGDGIVNSDPTDDLNMSFPLFAKHVGTGANDGKVRIRFYGSSLENSTEVYIDQVFVQYANVLNYAGINSEVDTALTDYDAVVPADLATLATAAALATVDGNVDAILVDTNALQTDWANGGRLDLILDARAAEATVVALNDLSAADVNAQVVDVLRTDTIPDSINADGSAPTIAQAIYGIYQFLTERAVSGTTVTVKKLDGSTSLMTCTLDDGTSPTSITRAS